MCVTEVCTRLFAEVCVDKRCMNRRSSHAEHASLVRKTVHMSIHVLLFYLKVRQCNFVAVLAVEVYGSVEVSSHY
jgi:hypothetical protein